MAGIKALLSSSVKEGDKHGEKVTQAGLDSGSGTNTIGFCNVNM